MAQGTNGEAGANGYISILRRYRIDFRPKQKPQATVLDYIWARKFN